MYKKILEKIGLTKNETKIYVALIEKGSALAGELSERTGIHRRNVYDSLERLIEKGLVSYVKINNKRIFNPANPNRFLEIIEEKKQELEKDKKEIKKIMPYFMKLNKQVPKQDVRFFRGAEGIKTVFEDILRTKKDYLGYGQGLWVEKKLKYYLPQYVKKRVANKISIKFIYEESSRKLKFTNNPLSTVRYLPDQYLSYTSRRIYADKLAIILFSEEDSLAILIKNPSIAKGARNYFKVLWNVAKP